MEILIKNNKEYKDVIVEGKIISYYLVDKKREYEYVDYRFYDIADYIRTNYYDLLLENYKVKEEKINVYINKNITTVLGLLKDKIVLDSVAGVYRFKASDEDSEMDLVVEKTEVVNFKGNKIEIPVKFRNARFIESFFNKEPGIKKYAEVNAFKIKSAISKVKFDVGFIKIQNDEDFDNITELADTILTGIQAKESSVIKNIDDVGTFLRIINIFSSYLKVVKQGSKKTIGLTFSWSGSFKAAAYLGPKGAAELAETKTVKGSLEEILWSFIDEDEESIIEKIISKSIAYRYVDIKQFYQCIIYEVFIVKSGLVREGEYEAFFNEISKSSDDGLNVVLDEKALAKYERKAKLKFSMIAIMIQCMFEEEIEEYVENKSFSNIMRSIMVLKKSIDNLKEGGNSEFNDNEKDKLKKVMLEKLREFLVIWMPTFLEIKNRYNDDREFQNEDIETQLKEFARIAVEYKKVTEISNTIITAGTFIDKTANVMIQGAGAAVGVSGLISFFSSGIPLAISSGAMGLAYSYKGLGLILSYCARDIAKAIVFEGENLKDIIPLLSLASNGMTQTMYNPLLKIVETVKLKKSIVKKLDSYFDKIESGEVIDIGYHEEIAEEILIDIVDVKCAIELFETQYLNRDVKDFLLYPDIEYKNEMKSIIEKEEEKIDLTERAEVKILEKIQENLSSENLLTRKEVRDYTEAIKVDSFFVIRRFNGKQFEIFLDNISNLGEMLKSLKENYSKFYKEVFIKQFEDIPKEQIYDGIKFLWDSFIDCVRIKIVTENEGTYVMIRLDKYSSDSISKLQDYKNKNFNSYKELFAYTSNQYYIENSLVGSVKESGDFDYILADYVPTEENYNEVMAGNMVGKIIDNAKFKYVTLRGRVDSKMKSGGDIPEIYDISNKGIERKMQKLRGNGILTCESEVIGKNLEYEKKDKKHFWERNQEYSFKIYEDKNGFSYYHSDEFNYL